MLVLGNWKLHTTLGEAVALASAVVHGADDLAADVGVCPPFVWLDAVAERLRGSRVALGAQTVSAEAKGAFTGEVSAAMLAEVGCRYAIVGHSERRALFGETDALVARKAAAAQAAGLTPVVCVGETLEERDAGDAERVVVDSLRASLDGVAASPLVVAYEPVWAIGTGRTASPEQAQAMHAALRPVVATGTPILYGGSVKADNAAELFAQPDLDGALVGGASLDAEAFLAIARAASDEASRR
jgi:triosephosphate isomerase